MINFNMAEIANSAVFTNRVSCDTPDLLQQAFQEVVNDEDHDNEFVTFLTGEGDETQTIQLTRAQASALSLTFEVDSTSDEQPEGIVYQQCQNDILNDIHNPNIESQKSSEETEQIDFDSTAQWTIDNIDENNKINGHSDDTHASVSTTLDIVDSNNQVSKEIIQNFENASHQDNVQAIFVQQSETPETSDLENIGPNYGEIQYAIGKHTAQNFSTNITQPQVLQRVIFPSSQFILKPAQAILKAGKGIRLIPASNKINANTNVTSVTTNNNINGQNTVLLPKTTILNSVSSQIFKTTPIASQVIHGNAISAQLLNSSQILSCDPSNQSLSNGNNDNNLITNGLRSIQNIGSNQIRLSPVITTTSTSTQGDNGQQFTTSISKNTSGAPLISKSQISNRVNSKITSSFLKSLQFPTQILKTQVGKLTNTSISTKVANTNPSIILKTGSRLKTQTPKSVTTSGIINRPTHTVSTPISILKPQTKVAFANSTKQNLIVNSQNLTSINNVQATRIVQKITQQNSSTENDKPAQINDIKSKNSEVPILTSPKIIRKPKIISTQNSMSSVSTSNEGLKSLGSNENPIQIIQQGNAFHSSQKLTQSQLKQLAHVLQQQRSQDSSTCNEKVVYRVVFPEELDLRIKNPINLLKGRGGKRGRPKKKPVKSVMVDDESEEAKDDRKKHVARTRSGRLSRPPRHIMRDYKHLHHLDFMEPDMDDSDGGYSDYNTSPDKLENEEVAKDLLTGYEGPKRKISDHFRCPTCNKIYLGRTRMAKHFEMHPDHGSPDQLPPASVETELKRPTFSQDQFKRKGKKRGPWAYITPEAKSERRQIKLKEALSACDSGEILKIAAKPVLNAQSLFDLMMLKSESCLKTFLNELKTLVEKAREQVSAILTPTNDEEKEEDVLQLDDDLLCNTLGLAPGVYNVNSEVFKKSSEIYNTSFTATTVDEPPLKLQKIHSDDCKENIDDESVRFTDNSDLNVSSFLEENKFDSMNSNCPEVLTALTLMPRNSSPISTDVNKTNNVSKLLISNPEIQNQISDNPGFQKIEMNSKNPSFKEVKSNKDGYSRVNDNSEVFNCSLACYKLRMNYDDSKLDNLRQAFIKLEQDFVKLENGTPSTYQKESSSNFEKLQSNFETIPDSQNFSKGFQKLIPKVSLSTSNDGCEKEESFNGSNKDVFSERLKNMMPDNILENNLMNNNSNLDTELDFEALSEEFNRNTSS
ncbi:uncharacterized protein [Chelonus insularis]|uniref:uncharacterized protein isoform X2 n=1 Tax=Chelonus insularis TaxID=460826 RepID=UPI00158AFD5A|nr:uncharacterized protein LOC118066646 isoform X2 [Chelonus insularis]